MGRPRRKFEEDLSTLLFHFGSRNWTVELRDQKQAFDRLFVLVPAQVIVGEFLQFFYHATVTRLIVHL